MNDVDVHDLYTESVTLWRFRVDNDEWWQFYDNNKSLHQASKLIYDDDSGEDVWKPEGYVHIPTNASNEEKQAAYLKFIDNLKKGLDG